MFDIPLRNFILPNKLAAISAIVINDRVIAIDGLNNCAFILTANCPHSVETISTLRTYRKIHYDEISQRIVALSGETNKRIYLLNTYLQEVGSVDLEFTPSFDTCELMDISIFYVNNSFRYAVSNRNSVMSYYFYGKQATIISKADITHLNLAYESSNNVEALYYMKNNIFILCVKDGFQTYNGIVPEELSLRSLLSNENGDIYGLFGYHYLYNYLIPIYEDGVFVMPREDNVGNILNIITTY